jgi:hypothetical protein
MLTGNKTLKNHPEIVELQKLTTGVNLVRRNSSNSITDIYAFGSGNRLILLDNMRKFDTIVEVNHYSVLMVTIHIIFMFYLIVFSLLLIDTSKERYSIQVKARIFKGWANG